MKNCAWFLGAHKGEDIIPLLDSFECYALEANHTLEPDLASILRSERILIRALVSPFTDDGLPREAGTMATFYSSEDKTMWGTLEKSRLDSGSLHASFTESEVQTLSLRILEEMWPKPSLIVADLEGSELHSLIFPMQARPKFYGNVILVVEVSRDNWKEILDELEKIYENFTILVNAEIEERVDGRYYGRQTAKKVSLSSSIGSYLYKTLSAGNSTGRSSSDTRATLDAWFKSKNSQLRFNFSAWLDLIAWPSSIPTDQQVFK